MVKFERLGEKIYGVMSGFGYDLKLYTEEGGLTIDPQEATRFFSPNPAIMVSIDKDNNSIDLSITKDQSYQELKDFQQRMKSLANEFLLDYKVKNYSKKLKPRDFSDQAKIKKKERLRNESILESLAPMYGDEQESYQDIGDVTIVIIHKKPINPDVKGSRSRHIDKIDVCNQDARFTMPTNHVLMARAMARHMDKGGKFDDEVGSHIQESASKIKELREFLKYTRRNNLINEDTQDVIETVKDSIRHIKKDMTRLIGVKTYESVSDKIKNMRTNISEDDSDMNPSDVKDMFSVKVFDSAYEKVAPVISNMVNERNHRMNVLENESCKPLNIPSDFDIIDESLEFENSAKKYSFIVSRLASLVESKSLSEELSNIAKKVNRLEKPTPFEYGLIENILSSIFKK